MHDWCLSGSLVNLCCTIQAWFMEPMELNVIIILFFFFGRWCQVSGVEGT